VTGSCEYGDEPSGCGARELVPEYNLFCCKLRSELNAYRLM
jgi:hypothetical protein